MKTCKDCLHVDVCEKLRPLEYCLDKGCSHFKPTADVVPKSEVEALEREIARLKKSTLPSYCQAVSEEEAIKIGKQYGRAEVAREIFEEIEKRSSMWGGERHINYKVFAELKKKYIGEKQYESTGI